MPHLSDLWSEISSKRQDVVFLAVNIGDSKDVIEKWWKDEGFQLKPVQQDGDAVSKAFGVQAYPTNYIIGPDGKILWRSVGFGPNMEEEMASIIAGTAKN
ncbi:MAG: TlpA family protein disulfide reductase [Planctomycetota bacterium]|nr:MAG: TlpA family protein disulfide reductase [Planctomycetota bacterium]